MKRRIKKVKSAVKKINVKLRDIINLEIFSVGKCASYKVNKVIALNKNIAFHTLSRVKVAFHTLSRVTYFKSIFYSSN